MGWWLGRSDAASQLSKFEISWWPIQRMKKVGWRGTFQKFYKEAMVSCVQPVAWQVSHYGVKNENHMQNQGFLCCTCIKSRVLATFKAIQKQSWEDQIVEGCDFFTVHPPSEKLKILLGKHFVFRISKVKLNSLWFVLLAGHSSPTIFVMFEKATFLTHTHLRRSILSKEDKTQLKRVTMVPFLFGL